MRSLYRREPRLHCLLYQNTQPLNVIGGTFLTMSARSFVQRDMSSMAERNLSNGHENGGDGLGDLN